MTPRRQRRRLPVFSDNGLTYQAPTLFNGLAAATYQVVVKTAAAVSRPGCDRWAADGPNGEHCGSTDRGNNGTVDAVLTVSLTSAPCQPVTVNWSTADGTATAPGDYIAGSGMLTFPAGETTRTIRIAVKGDTLVESDETFVVNLTNPVNATLGNSQGVVKIVNDDTINAPPQVAITSPAKGAIFIGPVTIPIDALATDIDGTIGKVELFGDGIKLGETTPVRVSMFGEMFRPGLYFLPCHGRSRGHRKFTANQHNGVSANQWCPRSSVSDVRGVAEGNAGTTNAVLTVRLSASTTPHANRQLGGG